jgi:hypothetical protein
MRNIRESYLKGRRFDRNSMSTSVWLKSTGLNKPINEFATLACTLITVHRTIYYPTPGYFT